ncbi:non-ribosomal peptide synthetase [Halalkalibacter alkalisediminis]|uniref:Non-ribosomal peptide synthetase n=1 Tax=Halalkalibacter alkalisediminis TaxID=935616 RepID=A0ABV6NN90_9BACI|nr:non-ribosomal peptide synthetase [Halalkalibacter alkalisediminis]
MKSLVYLFEESAKKHGDKVAVRNKDRQFSYKETNILANRFAQYLQNQGIQKGDNVGIYIEKSEYVLFFILALFKLGVTYVPIDPKSPAKRVKHIIKNSELKLLITDEETSENCQHVTSAQVIDGSTQFEGNNLNISIDPKNPAYIIFTSGSTGDPKGVCVTHGNVMSLFSGCESLFDFDHQDKWTFFHSYAFDFSVWEMWGAWLYGGEVIVVSFEESRSPISFVDLMVQTKTTIFNCTPSAFFEMSTELIKRQQELHLKYIIFGGEALNFKKLATWFSPENKYLPKLINMYGITETTVHVTFKEVKKCSVENGVTNIGKVLPHLDFKIMNDCEEEVSKGGEGELYISGGGLSIGYYNNPEMNEKKFKEFDNIRYYKSGDVVKQLDNNELQYISRNDEQVQLRGFRIELGEVESAYNELKEISNAVAITDTVFSDDLHLVLYYVAEEELPTSYLREAVSTLIPAYMIPSFFIKIDQIPLTVNGKLDKGLLPKFQQTVIEPTPSETIVVDEQLAAQIRKVIIDILGNEGISNKQSLLASGMNSLSIMKIIVKVRDLFNIELAPLEMLENDTILKLTSMIEVRLKKKEMQEYHPIEIKKRNEYPLTYEQENLWFIYHTNEDKSLYNIVFSYDITGEIDRKALENSFNKMGNLHQILKSTIREQGGKGTLVYDETIYHHFTFVDLSSNTAKEQAEKVEEFVKQETTRQFDIENGSLLSITLAKKSDLEYQLICNFHHIIFDGWSIPLLINTWFTMYDNLNSENQPAHCEEKIQYGDYAYWQKTSPTYISEKDQQFWSREISTMRKESLLPYDYPKTAASKNDSDIIRFSVPNAIQTKLEEINLKTKSTLFMSLLSAYQTFLSVYFDKEEIVVGSPLAKRNHADIEQLIGYFVNTLPFKLHIYQEESFTDVLRRNIKNITNVFDHQNLPIEQIMKYAAHAQDRSIYSTPLFDTVFVLQNNEKEKLTYETVQLQPRQVNSYKAIFDLVVQAEQINEELVISFEYNQSLFNKSTIQKMANNFEHWLHEITSEEETQLKNLSYIEPAQLQETLTLAISNRGHNEGEERKFEDVVSRFERQARSRPEDVAVVHGEEQLTYRELNKRANEIATYLHQNGVCEEDKIGVFMERSITMIASILAIMKVGAGYVPLDPSQPEERLIHMIDDSEIVYCLTNNGELTYPGDDKKLIAIDEIINLGEANEFQARRLFKTNLAYVIYTSGTTGKPKGVMIEHGGLANLCDWHIDYYSVTEGDAALLISSASFDASIWEMFPYLTNGNKLVILDYYDLLDVEVLSEKLENEKVSIAFFSTGLLEQLFINEMKFPDSIRSILTGGDRLKTIPNQLNFNLYNNYGPTEGTVVSTAHKVRPGDNTVIPIGKPILNVETYVFNSMMKLTPKGQVGELYIGGQGIARGYINNPEKNVESFVPNPFNPTKKLYKTGDLVKFTEDGDLLFIGRADDQVKIRGYRIELGEINAVLKKFDGIKDCIVTTKDQAQSKLIIAYFISDNEMAEADIHEHMNKHLPQYMIPSSFIRLDSFPLTTNGKVDMRSLSDLKSHRERTPKEKAMNIIEQKLLEIWEYVLNKENITISDNFFECGGDSILSIQICALAKKEHLFITSKDIFEKQCIEEIAKVVEWRNDNEITESDVYGQAPLTPIQKWFFSQNINNYNHWNQSVTLKGYPAMNENRLNQIVAQLVKHHDAFRTRFTASEEFSTVERAEKHQAFWQAVYLDHSNLREVQLQQEISQLEKIAQKGINIINGPLMRVVCLKTSEDEHTIIWIVHHLIVDGVSWRILLEDFDQLYMQALNNEEQRLSSKTTSFKKWANKLAEYKERIPENIEKYWVDECSKKYDHLLVKTTTDYAGESFALTLNQEVTHAIYNEITKAYNVTVDEVYLAVFTTLLGEYFNKTDVHFTLEGHGREELFDDVDLSRTVGWFTTMYPIYLEKKDSLSDTIFNIRKKLRTMPNKGIDYGILKDQLTGLNKPILSFNNLGKFHKSKNMFATEIHFFSEQDIQENSYTEHEIDIELLLVDDQQEVRVNYNRYFVQEDFENYVKIQLPKLLYSLREKTEQNGSAEVTLDFPIPDSQIIDVYDLTATQKGMLYHSLFDSDSSQYTVQLSFGLDGQLNIEKLKNAITKTMLKHDIFKTQFHSDKKGHFQQFLLHSVDIEIDYVDLWNSHLNLEQWMESQYKKIDIESNRINRFLIVKSAQQQYQLIWTFHHIIMDGWSYSMVINEIFDFYHAKVSLSAVDVPFKLYVEYMKRYMEQNQLKDYWNVKLQQLQSATSSLESFTGDNYVEYVYTKKLDHELSMLVQRYCQENKITANTFFLTIWLATLSELKGRDTVCCGVVTSGRNIPIQGIDTMVGPFINTIPFIKTVDQESTYKELMKEVQSELLEVSAFENTPLSKIQEWANSQEHLFDSLYAFENYPMTIASTDELTVSLIEGRETSHYPMVIVITPGTSVQIKFNEATIAVNVRSSIISTFNQIISQLLENLKVK